MGSACWSILNVINFVLAGFAFIYPALFAFRGNPLSDDGLVLGGIGYLFGDEYNVLINRSEENGIEFAAQFELSEVTADQILVLDRDTAHFKVSFVAAGGTFASALVTMLMVCVGAYTSGRIFAGVSFVSSMVAWVAFFMITFQESNDNCEDLIACTDQGLFYDLLGTRLFPLGPSFFAQVLVSLLSFVSILAPASKDE
mmetsp:Transcript_12522/g.23249  ORF Transcript_12522/g.23249 Transcript_12522/m.23249 type:complete len:199 (+) Transcript_12522:109-705(+)